MQTFKTDLISICGKEEITHVKYKQWMFTDNDQKQDITAEVTIDKERKMWLPK